MSEIFGVTTDYLLKNDGKDASSIMENKTLEIPSNVTKPPKHVRDENDDDDEEEDL